MGIKFGCDVFCAKCKTRMATLDSFEFDEFRKSGFDAGLCFDCEPALGAFLPQLFLGSEEGDIFRIGGELFTVELGVLTNYPPPHARAHDTRMRACLSSSTYLNRNNQNKVFFPDGVILEECKKCRGTGELDGFAYIGECSDCKGTGIVMAEIILPLWLVGGVVEDA